MTIGKLAAAAGVTAGTVRYYEQMGLLRKTPRTAAGYRMYSADAVRQLAVIRSAQRFGFSLREIAAFLRTRENGGRPCQQVRDAAERLLADVDAQIADLTERRRQMRETLGAWDRVLARTPSNRPARLLETLTSG